MGKAVVALLALTLSTGFSVVMPPAYQLHWLSGLWQHSGKDGRWAQEHWTPPTAGMMLGTGLAGQRAKATSFEFMRIEGYTFWASPQGKPAVPFKIVYASADKAVFENPAHDFPTRIAYGLEGDVLVATVSGPGGAKSQSLRYRRVRE